MTPYAVPDPRGGVVGDPRSDAVLVLNAAARLVVFGWSVTEALRSAAGGPLPLPVRKAVDEALSEHTVSSITALPVGEQSAILRAAADQLAQHILNHPNPKGAA